MASLGSNVDSVKTTGTGHHQPKRLADMNRNQLIAYILSIQPTDDSDALKFLEYVPLLDRAYDLKMKLEGLQTDDDAVIKLPALDPRDHFNLKQAKILNQNYYQEVRKQRQRQLDKSGESGDNDNNRNDPIDDMGSNLNIQLGTATSRVTGSKRSFESYSEDARVDALLNLSKNINVNDENAVTNLERISKAIFGGNAKKKRRKGGSMVYLILLYISPLSSHHLTRV